MLFSSKNTKVLIVGDGAIKGNNHGFSYVGIAVATFDLDLVNLVKAGLSGRIQLGSSILEWLVLRPPRPLPYPYACLRPRPRPPRPLRLWFPYCPYILRHLRARAKDSGTGLKELFSLILEKVT